ncbi:hypothetical protein STEG23_018611 [Scotinomys teguina]
MCYILKGECGTSSLAALPIQVTSPQKNDPKPLEVICKKFPKSIIYHYMDDILLADSNADTLERLFEEVKKILPCWGLQIAPEKIQKGDSINYLGYKIGLQKIRPQKVQIRRDRLRTLNDFQRLFGDISHLRTITGVKNDELSNLFKTLEGDKDLNSPRELTPEAEKELALVEKKVQDGHVDRVDPKLDCILVILPSRHSPTGILMQREDIILEWIFLPDKQSKKLKTYVEKISDLILKGKLRLRQLAGIDPAEIVVPLTKEDIEKLWAESEPWQRACSNFLGEINSKYPKSDRIELIKRADWILPRIVRETPISGVRTFYTDANKQGKAGYKSEDLSKVVQSPYNSVQKSELYAILLVLMDFSEPLNIVTDSQYAERVVLHIETAEFIPDESELTSLFIQLQDIIRNRKHPLYITHIQSHMGLPVTLAQVFSFVYDYETCQLLAAPIYFREDMGIEEPADGVNFHSGKNIKVLSYCANLHTPSLMDRGKRIHVFNPKSFLDSQASTMTQRTKKSSERVIQNLYIFKKEIEEELRKWKDLPCSWVGRITIVKMAILPKAIYRFNAIPIKIPRQFFTDLERAILNFIWRNKKPRIAKSSLYKKAISGGITIPDFKLYYRATVLKTAWYWHKNRHVDQWNRIEDPDINPHRYENLIFDKDAKTVKWKKESIFNKWCWHNWMATCRRLQIDPYLSPCTKLKSKWIKDLNINPVTLNLIEEKVGSTLECIGTEDQFLNITPTAQTLSATINQWEYMKLGSFCKPKDTITKTKHQPTEWEKIFTNPTADRGLISRIYKELKKHDIKTPDI